MRIERFNPQHGTGLQKGHQLLQILLHKAHAVHARVDLDVAGIVLHPARSNVFVEEAERLDIRQSRLQVIIHNLLETLGTRREHHDGQTHPGAAQRNPLVGKGDAQIIHAGILTDTTQDICSMAIGIGLDQHQHLHGGFQL